MSNRFVGDLTRAARIRQQLGQPLTIAVNVSPA
jgi:hypothetical protein